MRKTACFLVALLVGGVGGCGVIASMMTHFVGVAEDAPPLGALVEILDFPSFAPVESDGNSNGSDSGEPFPVLRPAEGATEADLAGVWVNGRGYAAVHINAGGRVYQIDLPDVIAGRVVPDIVPKTIFNVGNASVGADGSVAADLSVALLGFSAEATVRGTLNATHDIIYDAELNETINVGEGIEEFTSDASWYRWDAERQALAFEG